MGASSSSSDAAASESPGADKFLKFVPRLGKHKRNIENNFTEICLPHAPSECLSGASAA